MGLDRAGGEDQVNLRVKVSQRLFPLGATYDSVRARTDRYSDSSSESCTIALLRVGGGV